MSVFRETVSGLVSSVIAERCRSELHHHRVLGFVLGQCDRAPDHFRWPLKTLTVVFGASALPLSGRAFHALPHAQRWRHVERWRGSRLGFCRDLVRYYESLAIFGWYSERFESGEG